MVDMKLSKSANGTTVTYEDGGANVERAIDEIADMPYDKAVALFNDAYNNADGQGTYTDAYGYKFTLKYTDGEWVMSPKS